MSGSHLLLAAFLGLAPLAAGASERTAPSFTLKDIDGKKFDLSDRLGKDVVLVNFFATWCAPCQAELPILQRFHEKYASEGLSIVVVSIDDPKSAAKVKPLIREQKYTFPVLLDTQTKVVSLYNPKKVIPFSAIIDRAGRIHSQKFGFQPGDETKLEEELLALLKAGATDATATPPAAPEAAPAPVN